MTQLPATFDGADEFLAQGTRALTIPPAVRTAGETLLLAAAAVQDGNEAGEDSAQSAEWSGLLEDLSIAQDAFNAAIRAAEAAPAGNIPVQVWLLIDDDTGEGAAKVYATKAEADADWRAHAEALWRANCTGKPPKSDQALCAGLQGKGCTEWKIVESQTINVPMPAAPVAPFAGLSDVEREVLGIALSTEMSMCLGAGPHKDARRIIATRLLSKLQGHNVVDGAADEAAYRAEVAANESRLRIR